MNRASTRFRAVVVLAAAGLLAGVGAVVSRPAHAGAGFSLSRLQGTDRYQTAGVIDQAAFPSGEPAVLLADGLPGHQTDALAASGLEGVGGFGVLITDNGTSVPSNTLAALKANGVKNIAVLGGSQAVTPQEVTQLQQAGYTVTTPFAGTTRYQTMQKIDGSISPSSVGKDAAGNPTAILASGDNAHFVDALSAGGLAFSQKFPIILTNSQGPGLQPEAQQVITALGIKHLIVAGGTASIPRSEYSPAPSGVTVVTVEAGSDRSQTSQVLADYAISSGWLGNTAMTVARGDDGSDALAGAAFAGVKHLPTVVTDSTTALGSAGAFATEHSSTLTGASYIFGGSAAVSDAQMSAIETAAGAASTCPAGTIAANPVASAGNTSFVQGGCSYAYGSGDTYQLATTSSTPGASPSCTNDSYADFQARLSQGDSVTGTYKPGGTSTFCLNDVAPAPPSAVSAAGNGTGGGVTVTWTAPSTAAAQGVTGYQVWRAPATVPNPSAPSSFYTCPNAYTVAPGTSPQTPPASPYAVIGTVTQATSGTSYTYNDTTATASSYYCYAVSSVAPAASGANAPATAQPNNPPSPLTPGAGQPTQALGATAGAAPKLAAISVQGQTVTLTYNAPINPASVASDGSQFTVTAPGSTSPTSTTTTSTSTTTGSGTTTIKSHAWGTGSTVYLDLVAAPTSGPVTVTSQNGSNGTTVCAQNATSGACEATGESMTASTVTAAGTAPKITGVAASASAQTITLTFSESIDCVTVDPSGAQFQEAVGGSSGQTPSQTLYQKAACVGSGPTSSQVVLSFGPPLVPQEPIAVSSTTDSSYGPVIAGPGQGAAEASGDTASGTAGQ